MPLGENNEEDRAASELSRMQDDLTDADQSKRSLFFPPLIKWILLQRCKHFEIGGEKKKQMY